MMKSRSHRVCQADYQYMSWLTVHRRVMRKRQDLTPIH